MMSFLQTDMKVLTPQTGLTDLTQTGEHSKTLPGFAVLCTQCNSDLASTLQHG